jgi:hypothetical protein
MADRKEGMAVPEDNAGQFAFYSVGPAGAVDSLALCF